MPRCQYIRSNYLEPEFLLLFNSCHQQGNYKHEIQKRVHNCSTKRGNWQEILGQAPYYSRNLLHVSNFDFDGPLSVQGFALDLMLIKANNGFLRDLEFPPLQKAKTNLVPCGRLRLGNLKILYTYDNFPLNTRSQLQGKVCLLALFKVKRYILPEISLALQLFIKFT